MKHNRKLFQVLTLTWEEAIVILDQGTNDRVTVTDRDNKQWNVKTSSQRYRLFRQNRQCVSCGCVGEIMSLDTICHQGIWSAHFNLYTRDGILMTKDHIVPRSKGGRNHMSNYQTMCHPCNLHKGSSFQKA